MSPTEKPTTQQQPNWRTFAHLFAFGLLLALAMILVRGTPGDSEDGGRVVFTEADVAQVRAKFMRTWNRQPTAVELRKGFAQYIRDEILYREALARNLDRADPTLTAQGAKAVLGSQSDRRVPSSSTSGRGRRAVCRRRSSYTDPPAVVRPDGSAADAGGDCRVRARQVGQGI